MMVQLCTELPPLEGLPLRTQTACYLFISLLNMFASHPVDAATLTANRRDLDPQEIRESDAAETHDFRRTNIILTGLDVGTGIDKRRFGPDVAFVKGACGIEGACGGVGAVVGIIDPTRHEYFAGMCYYLDFLWYGTYWAEFAARVSDQTISGGHVRVAAGYVVMPYLSAGYDVFKKRPTAELGLSFKLSVFRW